MKPIRGVIPAGAEVTYPATGTRINVKTATNALRLMIDSPQVGLDVEQGYKLNTGVGFKQIRLRNDNAVAVTFSLLVGSIDVELPIPNVVSVIDGAVSRTVAGVTFMIESTVNALAANYNHHQLWNTPGSGFNLVVKKVRIINFSGASRAFFYESSAVLSSTFSNSRNKNVGNAGDTVGITGLQQSTSSLAGTDLGMVTGIPVSGTSYIEEFTEPFVVEPGKGILVYNDVVNQTTQVNFEYYKEPI